MDLRRIAQTNNIVLPAPLKLELSRQQRRAQLACIPEHTPPAPLPPSHNCEVPADHPFAICKRAIRLGCSEIKKKSSIPIARQREGAWQGAEERDWSWPADHTSEEARSAQEEITSIPSRIAFEISIFPHNLPLPESKTSAYIIGGLMHLINFYVRVTQVSDIPDSDIGWEDMYREDNNVSWFDWTIPMTALLILAACANALYLFTRTRLYHLYTQPDPVASPHARFHRPEAQWGAGDRVQELEVWTPGDFELMLFSVYSPVHALLWMCWNSGNWIKMAFVMAGVGIQLRIMTQTYEALLKDRGIIAAEVMHEYDQKFVYPRVNPIRSDASVQTHEGEVVNVWED
ncbi:hypothetical protein EVG20_g1812 [Dentipellis fragilis]|uniref:Uncharacterized protein n=1 Tax=Dentipellis fragilis TaxID=205917 RepID=A0A4Y9ZAL1_9AGAM|nr:hypothetical protein EVG20_g1812 [Dentipellis fragilis]